MITIQTLPLKEDEGNNLLRDLKTFKYFNIIEFNKLKSINKEIKENINNIEKLPEEEITESLSIEYVILTKRLLRNKRILDSYIFIRRQEIINNIFLFKSSIYLSEEEKIFKNEFNNLLNEYKEDIGIELINEEPPSSLFIEIFTNCDCGIIIQNGEVIELKQGMVFYIKKHLVRHLLNTNKVTY